MKDENTMQGQSLTPIQIRTFLFIMKKHKWKILSIFFITAIGATVGSLLVAPIYRASSQLLVKPGREDVYIPPTARTEDSPAVFDPAMGQKINSEIAILTSPGLLMRLVDSFGVNRLFDFPDRTLKGWLAKQTVLKGTIFETILTRDQRRKPPRVEEVYKSVEKSLKVSGVRRSNVISVSFDWPDPTIAARVVNSLINLYLMQHVKVHRDPQTYTLLKEQANKWEEKLRESEKQLEAFKRRHSITSLPEQRTILLQSLSEAESRNKGTENQIQETLEMVRALEGQLSNLDRNVKLQETVNKQSETLAALKTKLVDLELQGLRDEIRRVKEMIAEEEKKEQGVVVSGTSPVRQNLEGNLLKAKAQLKALKAREENEKLQLATYQKKLRDLEGYEKQLNALLRDVTINESSYELYLTKFEEAKISEAMDQQKIANVRVIEPAAPPFKPIKPKKRLIVLIGGFLGLFLGLGMAFLIEFTHPVFRTREDIDQFLGLPVLAVLPKER
jgi:uncharacterized protein involved in exopolysaccharide biosynthesis